MSGDLSGVADKEFDLLIVGAGLSGAVLAERCSKELGMTSLIIDCRNHIGGNCYDYIDEHGEARPAPRSPRPLHPPAPLAHSVRSPCPPPPPAPLAREHPQRALSTPRGVSAPCVVGLQPATSPVAGIRASKYGAHLFHTKFERVWGYVQQFSQWIPFDHRVKGAS